MKYLAIIGDIVDSRRIRNRANVQLEFEAALDQINKQYKTAIASGFLITLGDEFQGLLSNPESFLQIVLLLERRLTPVHLRYGIGWGSLETPIRATSLGMDGPCFHMARDSVIKAKEESRWIQVQGFGEGEDAALNGILNLVSGVRKRWKPVQAETVRLMKEVGVQKEVASLRGVSTSVVSETLKAAQYKSVSEAENSVAILMQKFAQEKA